MTLRNVRLSRTSAMHYMKLIFRSALFLLLLVVYLYDRIHVQNGALINDFLGRPVLMGIVWLVFALEMVLRFFPSNVESMGCQKQFAKNYIAAENPAPLPDDRFAVLLVAFAWLVLNGIFGLLYHFQIIDTGILLLISLAYSVCDMICILFFCPFETWFLHNKCCGTCRIYNWDYAMMFTPLFFIPSWFSLSLFALGLALLIEWEVIHWRHPERFYEATNQCLTCANCKEKLCTHKKALHKLWLRQREQLAALEEKLPAAINRLEEKIPEQIGLLEEKLYEGKKRKEQ